MRGIGGGVRGSCMVLITPTSVSGSAIGEADVTGEASDVMMSRKCVDVIEIALCSHVLARHSAISSWQA